MPAPRIAKPAKKPFGPATKAPNPGIIRKSKDTITRYEDRSAVRNKGAGKATPNPRAVARANVNASFKRSGGINLPKFAGEVSRNVGGALDAMLPSRGASRTVGAAMRPRSAPTLSSKGNPVAEFMRNFIKIGK